MEKNKVLLIDDHPLVRVGLAQLINQEPDLTVVGEAGDAQEAMSLIDALKPDILLVDISLSGMDGLELIKHIRSRFPQMPMLMLSMHDENIYAERALRAGARGYIMKQDAPEQVIKGIRAALRGDNFLSENMSSRILKKFLEGGAKGGGSPVECLSDRELEVFRLIGKWRGTRQIAQDLSLSVKTIETHYAHIKKKLNLRSADELTQFAVQWTQDAENARMPGGENGQPAPESERAPLSA